MILSLIGPDDYRREKRRRFLVEEFRKKYGLHGVEKFIVSNKEGREKFHELVISPSLFSPKRLAVLEGAFEVEDKDFLSDLKRVSADPTMWVFVSERDKVPAIFKFITKPPATFEEFPFLESEGWKKFVFEEAKSRGVVFEPEAFRVFLRSYENDTWRMATELDRLSSKGGVIKTKDLNRLDGQAAFNLWGALTQLRGSILSQRLYTLEKIFMNQEPAAKIFNIMAAQAGGGTARFAEYDVAIKSGKLEYEEVLLDFVLQ
jgi:DNA polymerase III delta subunit